MENIEIVFESTSNDIANEALMFFPEHGIHVEGEMFKAKSAKLSLNKVVIAIALGAGTKAGDLACEWMLEKIKGDTEQKTVINGNQINANTVTLQEIKIIVGCHTSKNTSNVNKSIIFNLCK